VLISQRSDVVECSYTINSTLPHSHQLQTTPVAKTTVLLTPKIT
jgi:hypothetical protein